MRVLIVDTYYSDFLSTLYAQSPDLALQPYSEQWRSLMDQCFGTADFYSTNLNALGHEATEVVLNCEPLQRQWAKQNRLSLDRGWTIVRRRGVVPWPRRTPPPDWHYAVLMAQVKQFSPDVLYVQDMNDMSPAFLREVRPLVKLIVGQIACPIMEAADFKDYDLILSSFPHYVDQFRRNGLTSEYFKLSFEPRVLEGLTKEPAYDAVFVGSLSTNHAERIQFLEQVASLTPLEVWGPGVEALTRESPLRQRHHGDAWAREMYRVLSQAKLALNYHLDSADVYANNMRLFEATGVGTLLITDWKVNLSEMFEPGKEVVTYRTPEECAELIEYYLDHPDERAAIAQAGQRRTLQEHTFYHRMQELSAILERHLSSRPLGRATKSR
jgi:hypothetical protein